MARFVIEGSNNVIRLELREDGDDITLLAYEHGDTSPWYVLGITAEGRLRRHNSLPPNIGFSVDDEGYIELEEEK